MDMDCVGAFELEYGRMVDFSRLIAFKSTKVGYKISMITMSKIRV